MRRSAKRGAGLGWVCAAAAPWALATGLVVSFTASAGQDADSGFSAAPAAVFTSLATNDLVPAAPGLARASLKVPGVELWLASLDRSERLDGPAPAVEAPLRGDLKMTVHDYPQVERAHKGDPLVAIRPTISRRGLDIRIGHGPRIDDPRRIAFSRDERALPPTVMMNGALDLPDQPTATTFEPWSDPGTTVQGSAPASPGSSMNEMTYDPSRPPDALDGGTPSVPRAVVLGSTTPAPADSVPVEIAAAPVSILPGGRNTSAIAKSDEGQPRYAALINPDNMDREERCLAEAVYFEARSEPEEGQAAVAQVVLNRVKSGLYPKSVCGVVFQNRNRYKACQFSFACEGRSLRITEPESWKQAVRVARDVTQGKTYLAEVGGATHYHADYVRPFWARKLKKMDVIGRHIFYKLRPGQT